MKVKKVMIWLFCIGVMVSMFGAVLEDIVDPDIFSVDIFMMTVLGFTVFPALTYAHFKLFVWFFKMLGWTIRKCQCQGLPELQQLVSYQTI